MVTLVVEWLWVVVVDVVFGVMIGVGLVLVGGCENTL